MLKKRAGLCSGLPVTDCISLAMECNLKRSVYSRAGHKTKDAGLTTFPFLREALASPTTGPVP